MSEKDSNDSGKNENKIPSVMSPYRDTVWDYLAAGFRGPLPVPYREKDPVPIDFNKRVSKYPSKEKIQEWADGRRSNICVRLAGVDEEHEIIGIDVDQYAKGDKDKKGHDQLLRLQNRLGKLPDTWISSSRTDGKSGIRYFRVPRGLAFRGKVDKDIEVLRKGHRYAMVWPSVHPDGMLYWWFPPSVDPDENGKGAWDGKLPDARKFPLLPDKWTDFLTNGRVLSPDDEVIDVDSSVQEIYDWATDTFHGDDDSQPCELMRSKLDAHIEKVRASSTFHDLLTNAHWNIVRLAFEGHVGWNEAINEYEKAFVESVIARNGGSTDRTMQTLHNEIFRSRVQALRKVKGDSDARVKMGAPPVDPLCTKVGHCGADAVGGTTACDEDDPLGDVPMGAVKAVPEYECNDDGNAKHFYDMFSEISEGPSIRFAEGYGWLVWHKGNSEHQPHWERDEFGNQETRRMWQKVKVRQQAYADACFGDWQQKAKDFLLGANGVTDLDVKIAKAVYDKWNRWSEQSGNNRQAENALKAAISLNGVSISLNSLDQNPYLLGVANGVVELDGENVRLRPARPNDFITLNTGTKYEKPSDHAQKVWQDYLDTFLPDRNLQHAAKVALGHTLIGGNPEKIMIVLKGDPNTGKSTMVNAIEAALGDYAQSVSHTIFQNHKLNPVLANAIEKRVIVCSEFDENDELSASTVKRLTGGSDKIQAELKGSNATKEGIPQFVPILATNSVPEISGADKALQNRLYVIPFNVVPNRIEKTASNVLMAIGGTAVLNWLIEGYIEYRQIGGLPRNKEINDQTKEFMSELDPIAAFAHECLAVSDHDGKISRRSMYDRFKRWWIENEYQSNKKPEMPTFTRRLKSLGFATPNNKTRIDGQLTHAWVNVKFQKKESNIINMPENITMNVQKNEGDKA